MVHSDLVVTILFAHHDFLLASLIRLQPFLRTHSAFIPGLTGVAKFSQFGNSSTAAQGSTLDVNLMFPPIRVALGSIIGCQPDGFWGQQGLLTVLLGM